MSDNSAGPSQPSEVGNETNGGPPVDGASNDIDETEATEGNNEVHKGVWFEEEDSDIEDDEGLVGVDIKAECLLRVRYLSDGENDEELLSAREKLGKTRKIKKSKIPFAPLIAPSDEEADPLEQILKKRAVVSQSEAASAESEPKTEGYDSSEFGSLVGSDEEPDHDDAQRKKSRVKQKVLKDVAGNVEEEFASVWDYANELHDKNLGSTIKVQVNRVTPESPAHFKRFYVCFGALNEGWKEGCRRILGVDGCFLKGPFKGELLSAVGKDGNGQM